MRKMAFERQNRWVRSLLLPFFFRTSMAEGVRGEFISFLKPSEKIHEYVNQMTLPCINGRRNDGNGCKNVRPKILWINIELMMILSTRRNCGRKAILITPEISYHFISVDN